MTEPLATHSHETGNTDATIEFLKRTRFELRELRMVRVWQDRLQIFDINLDTFEVHGVGYPDADIVPILQHINTNFKPETIHEPTTEPYKQFKTGRRRPWAEDRVM